MTAAADNPRPPHRWALCLDGTWNRSAPRPGVALSNAAWTARFVSPAGLDGVQQVVFYQEGLGTRGPFDRYVCGYTGWGVGEKIREAYQFVARNWRRGDSIFLFGISRGAFAALAVSRLLGRYGIPAGEGNDPWARIWPAWLADEELSGGGWTKPPVDFLGAWDTVEALGLPFDGLRAWTSPRVGPRGGALGATVRRAFHALAYHERRIAFEPTVWQAPFPDGARVEQRWFRGAHADVCGGFGNPSLADVTLAWMLGQAREAGLAFNEKLVARELHPEPLAPTSPLRVGWHRILPFASRRPGQPSPNRETMDETLREELSRTTDS